MQDSVYLLGDGHFDVARAGQVRGRGSGEDAFRDHSVHGGNDIRKSAATAQFDADATVARESTGAGKNQIAQARQSRHSFGAAAAGYDQPRYFRQAACDQPCYGIVPQAESITNSGGDGYNVFERAAEFHANYIAIGIDAEVGVAEFLLHNLRQV